MRAFAPAVRHASYPDPVTDTALEPGTHVAPRGLQHLLDNSVRVNIHRSRSQAMPQPTDTAEHRRRKNVSRQPYALSMKALLGGAALAASILVLTGCAGSSSTAGPSSQPASVTPTPTPTPTASIAQFASILTEREKGWRDYEANIMDCAFASIGTAPIDSMKRTTCGYTVQTITLTAKQAAVEIRRLPAPPKEIESLVARTLRSLDTIAKNDTPTACKDTQSATCDAAITQANGDIRFLTPVLDAWKPYTR